VKGATDAEQIALKTFQPTWFVVYCFRVLGRNETVKFLEGNIYPPPTFIRLNTLRASQEEIVSKLEAEGVKLLKIKPLKHTYKVVESKQPLTSLISYREGMLYVQDKASCFVSEIANPQPHTTILDVCAAPGAKTTHLAQLMKNQGTIYSIDYSTRRIRTWKTETQRMNVTIAEPVLADARSKLPVNVDADVVVLDPPCTSTGSFGRQPSGKWRLTANSYEAMAQIQWFMINTVAENVKPQGSLIYTTDSIMVEENELIIERFLKWHPEFHLTKILPEYGLPGLRGLTRCRRFYPNLHESNSTFIAKLQKT
jgi:16S rRNA (cytosine967-C5)-methyltransferase